MEIAIQRINEWIRIGNINKLLDLTHLGLTSLPELPSDLKILECYENQLTSLPNNLPSNLQKLYCSFNKLKRLPNNLPTNLQILYCSFNELTSLPKLPTSLQYLYCDINNLTRLPSNLPSNLYTLYCNNNKLTSLPDLPPNLHILICDRNLLINLPILPQSIQQLFIDKNPFLYNRINIIKKFPNHNIFEYKYSFSNYKILLKLQRKQLNKTRKKFNKILLQNRIMYNDLNYSILQYI